MFGFNFCLLRIGLGTLVFWEFWVCCILVILVFGVCGWFGFACDRNLVGYGTGGFVLLMREFWRVLWVLVF